MVTMVRVTAGFRKPFVNLPLWVPQYDKECAAVASYHFFHKQVEMQVAKTREPGLVNWRTESRNGAKRHTPQTQKDRSIFIFGKECKLIHKKALQCVLKCALWYTSIAAGLEYRGLADSVHNARKAPPPTHTGCQSGQQFARSIF